MSGRSRVHDHFILCGWTVLHNELLRTSFYRWEGQDRLEVTVCYDTAGRVSS